MFCDIAEGKEKEISVHKTSIHPFITNNTVFYFFFWLSLKITEYFIIKDRKVNFIVLITEPPRGLCCLSAASITHMTLYVCCATFRNTDIVYIYCSVIRSVLEYACPVWHPGLTSKLSKDIERVQKRCFRIIFPQLSYSEALDKSGLIA